MLVFDLHLDLALSALGLNRDLTLSIEDCRRSEAGIEGRMRGHNTVTLPEMRRGHAGLCIATVLGTVAPGREGLALHRTHHLAYAGAQGMLAYYRELEHQGWLRMLRTAGELDAAAAKWGMTVDGGRETDDVSPAEPSYRPPSTARRREAPPPISFLLGTEGADCIVSPSQLEHWWDLGLRAVSLVHFGVSQYAHGTGTDGGLTPAGRDLLRAMDELGAILDVSHQSDASFWESLELFKGPVFASHQNCRALVPGARQFSDDQLRALIQRDAVIGHALDNWQLYPNYVRGQTPKSAISRTHLIDQVDHVAQLAGSARHSAIGSDLDGVFGCEQTPAELDTIADLQQLPALFTTRGYTPQDAANILSGNALRFFKNALPGHPGGHPGAEAPG